ncbi:hypothetical protein YB2330_002490 [Saitoella coloradoensis]
MLHHWWITLAVVSWNVACLAASLPSREDFGQKPLPVVIWHGMGDNYQGDGLLQLSNEIREIHPEIYIHTIYISTDPSSDRSATFFGCVDRQVEAVCEQLRDDPELAGGFDAIGFSQGGQFLRAYVERCNDPPVRNLITWGSQHNGIADMPACKDTDWVCKSARNIARSNVWGSYVRDRIVQAQYYRDPEDMENYLEYSAFLADVNNERGEKNATYAKNLATLENFVMLMFKDEQTVVPKETSWFAEKNVTSDDVTLLRHRPIYQEDWIGLKALDERGGLTFLEVPGEHMQISTEAWTKMAKEYLGPRKAVGSGLKLQAAF